MKKVVFRGDKVMFHPGYYIEKYMEEIGISVKDFSIKLGIDEIELTTILNGYKDIDEKIAEKLSSIIGTSPKFWTNLQKSYDEFIKENK